MSATKQKTLTLSSPIKRGDENITSITLRKPDAGSLRGVALSDVVRMDVDALAEVVPRLSQITEQEFRQLEPYDLMMVGKELTTFFVMPPN
ncbi:hypothetical protein AB835_11630 [Candidatus Endobugula sertula]|uniref:Phage tail protein n=1 Tax=Candidatus Endobugula sertula TaxID=62101 RepID=A0A1D2QMV9_9GAMM|nr:hypothetical protein AB835_11630 [Candidatus Endobugula sertula]